MDINDYEEGQLLNLAHIAETSERYVDMCAIIKKLIENKCKAIFPLSIDERNLLSAAYKNVVGAKRQSWRTLQQSTFINLEKNQLDYQQVIEEELEVVCMEVITLLHSLLEVTNKNIDDTDKYSDEKDKLIEDKVFYLKMFGDYNRYLSEFRKDDEKVKTNAENYYKEAVALAKDRLSETHPITLGLSLNYSVFCVEILKRKEQACNIAKNAFDSAIDKLDTLNDSAYKDATLIMQLLRDNLTLWTSESKQEIVW